MKMFNKYLMFFRNKKTIAPLLRIIMEIFREKGVGLE